MLFAWTLGAAAAYAQNMFYREVAKDGRVYVFSIMKEFEAWEASGEMGKAITRPGYGPNGETVVFDGEDAINLYNFKHGKPGEVFKKPVEPPKPPDNFSVRVGGTIFADFTYTAEPAITDSDNNRVKRSEFEVRRAYLNVTGTINDIVSFRITPDIAARQTTTATGLPAGARVTGSLDGSLVIRLKYAFGQLSLDRFLPHGSWARIGQQQTPYVDFMEGICRCRFQGTIFSEREGFLSSSDVGVSARVNFPSDYGEIHAGFYNGETYSRAEVNDQKAFQVRGTLRPLPKNESAKGLRLSLFYDADRPVKATSRNRFIGAATFEHKYLIAGAEYLDTKDQAGIAAAAIKANGWSVFAQPRSKVGVDGWFRYDSLKPNKGVDARKSRTILGAVYWFKVQRAPFAAAILADYEQVKYDAALARPNEKRYELKTLFNF
jgi:hypothetical protein